MNNIRIAHNSHCGLLTWESRRMFSSIVIKGPTGHTGNESVKSRIRKSRRKQARTRWASRTRWYHWSMAVGGTSQHDMANGFV